MREVEASQKKRLEATSLLMLDLTPLYGGFGPLSSEMKVKVGKKWI